MPTYRNAHAKLKKWIYDIQYPGNRFEFDIISNDFWSSTIWAGQSRHELTGAKTQKNPGIQPIYGTLIWNHFAVISDAEGYLHNCKGKHASCICRPPDIIKYTYFAFWICSLISIILIILRECYFRIIMKIMKIHTLKK